MDKELRHQINRLSAIVDKLISIENQVDYLYEKLHNQRVKLNDCIYKLRHLKDLEVEDGD